VDALRKIHSALEPGGILVDSQPVAPRAPVYAGQRRLGSVNTREFAATVRAIDAEFDRAIALGLFALDKEESVEVAECFDDGPECADDILDWNGARLSSTLEAAIRRAGGPLAVRLEIRLRILVATSR
jgi:hypothetical protein